MNNPSDFDSFLFFSYSSSSKFSHPLCSASFKGNPVGNTIAQQKTHTSRTYSLYTFFSPLKALLQLILQSPFSCLPPQTLTLHFFVAFSSLGICCTDITGLLGGLNDKGTRLDEISLIRHRLLQWILVIGFVVWLWAASSRLILHITFLKTLPHLLHYHKPSAQCLGYELRPSQKRMILNAICADTEHYSTPRK